MESKNPIVRNAVTACNANIAKLNKIKDLFDDGFYNSSAEIKGNKVIVYGGTADWCADVLWENGFSAESESMTSTGHKHTITVR